MTTYLFLRLLPVIVGVFFFTAPSVTLAAVVPDDPANFITTWNTENDGTSGADQITIPGTGGGYNYNIYWENVASSTISGTTTVTTASVTLTFPEPGIYEVQASGTFPRIYFNNGGDADKILTVEQWGDIAWTTMNRAFYGASNLRIPATDAPDLSGVTSLHGMFRDATSFNDSIDHWDVSTITSLRETFFGATAFNQPLNSWNTASVTDMWATFTDATVFNQPLDNWDVSNVTVMHFAFQNAKAFNQPLNSWDVSSVSGGGGSMQGLFQNTSFNQPLDSWDVSNVDSIGQMFADTPFNQDISMWDVGNVWNFAGVFRNNTAFNQPLNTWDTSSARNMESTFGGATSFDQPLDQWDTASVEVMVGTFANALAFDQDLSSWDMTSVVPGGNQYINGAENMFRNAGLSRENLDSTLHAWSQQALQNDVPFHLGLKTYSATGAAAIAVLEDTYNWDVREQYQLRYLPGENASLIGESTQIVDGAPNCPAIAVPFVTAGPSTNDCVTDGSEVTVDPRGGYDFVSWSDGLTTRSRTDTNVSDNLTVGFELEREGTQGTSAQTQRRKAAQFGNEAAVAAIEARLDRRATSAGATTSLTQVRDTLDGLADSVPDELTAADRDTIRSLIDTLLELVQVLAQLLLVTATGTK